jgi:hypothetical protein
MVLLLHRVNSPATQERTMLRKLMIALVFVLSACGAVVENDAAVDAGERPLDDAAAADAGELPFPDAGRDTGTSIEADAGEPERYACDPHRTPGVVSHNDCRRYPDRPICDAISQRCVPLPVALCGACETDEQCRNVDLRARCVFMPSGTIRGEDSACLVPCDDGCDWIQPAYGWSAYAQCFGFAPGAFCSPDWGGNTHCRNADSTRQGTCGTAWGLPCNDDHVT